MVTKDKKNANIELLRIVAFVWVVAAHYFMHHRISDAGEGYQTATVFMESFAHCSTPVFFMITGFFMFDKERKAASTIKYVFTRILLPAWVVILMGNVLDAYLQSKASLWSCITRPDIDFENLLYTVLMWHNGAINAYHTWYLFALAYIYILYPVLKIICTPEKKMTQIRRYVLFVSILYFVGKGTFDEVIGRQVFFWPAVFAYWPVIYVLLGYEGKLFWQEHGYEHSTKGGMRRYQLMGAILFVLGGLLTYLLSMKVDIGGNGIYGEVFLEYTMLGVFINALGLFIWGMSVPIGQGLWRRIVLYLGDKTYVAYLVHLAILIKCRSLGMEVLISTYVTENPVLHALLSVLLYSIFAMATSIAWNRIKKMKKDSTACK